MKEIRVETWGQGPWFELERDDEVSPGVEVDTPDAAPVGQGDALAAPAPQDEDITRDADTSPANIFDLETNVGSPDASLGAYLDASYDPNDPSAWGADWFGADDSALWSRPSQPQARPIAPRSFSPTVPRAVMKRPYVPRASDEDADTGVSFPAVSRRTLRRGVLAGVGVLLFALTASLFTGLYIQGFGWPFGQRLSIPALFATPTATGITPAGTKTPGPPPNTAAIVHFSAQTQQLTAAGDISSCPSGCDLAGQAKSGAQTFTKQASASQIPQTSLTGVIHVTNNSSTTDWNATNYRFSGGGYSCNPRNLYLVAGTQANVTCYISTSSPSSLPAGTIAGTASASPNVTYTQPNPLVGDGSYQVTTADCRAALDDTETNQGAAWAPTWQANQTIPSGWQWATSAPTVSYGSESCPAAGQQQPSPFTFTVSSVTTASNNAIDPAAAQSLSTSRLTAQLPSGYGWPGSGLGTCSPTVKGNSGTRVTLSCPLSSTAVYTWTSALKADLVARMAGKSKDEAATLCNATPGVQPNSCAITLRNGGTTMPTTVADIFVEVQ